jgi:hypothetical protein
LEEPRDARTINRGVWIHLEQADHGEHTPHDVFGRFGESPKLKLSGDDSRRELVHVLLDYPTELVALSIYRPMTGFGWNSWIADVLASLPRGGFRWGHGGRRLTGACHLSNSLTCRRGLLPWPLTTYPSHGDILIAGETDPYPRRDFSENLWTVRLTQWRAYLTDQIRALFYPIFMWYLSQLSASKLYIYNPSSTLPQCLPSNSHWIPFKIELKVHPITLLLKIQSRDWLTARLWA